MYQIKDPSLGPGEGDLGGCGKKNKKGGENFDQILLIHFIV